MRRTTNNPRGVSNRRIMRECWEQPRVVTSGSLLLGKISSTHRHLRPLVRSPTTTLHTMALQHIYHNMARALTIIPHHIPCRLRVPLESFDLLRQRSRTTLTIRTDRRRIRMIPFTNGQQSGGHSIPRAIILLMMSKKPVSCATSWT